MKTELILIALLSAIPAFAQVEWNKKTPVDSSENTIAFRVSNLCGIGAILKKKDASFVIMKVLPSSGVEQAGLKDGDAITHLDGKPLAALKLAEVVDLLRGNPDTTVVLKIERSGESPRDITVTRHPIVLSDPAPAK